ncbi:hypothetical protein E4T56_gene12838 [Termitomyces sp. T112]|nr:hypothetical protein E4T56_gene12838 [Termitomyces sp. T112]
MIIRGSSPAKRPLNPAGRAKTRVSRLAENGGSEASKDTAAEGDSEISRGRKTLWGFGGHGAVDNLVAELVDCELTDGVGEKTSIDLADTTFTGETGKAANKAGGVTALGDKSNMCWL